MDQLCRCREEADIGLVFEMRQRGMHRTYEESNDPSLDDGEMGGENREPRHGRSWEEVSTVASVPLLPSSYATK